MWGKTERSWSIREGGVNRVGEEDDEDEDEEAQRSLLDTGGDPGSSSKNDLLLPHTIADILSSSSSTIYSLRLQQTTIEITLIPEIFFFFLQRV